MALHITKGTAFLKALPIRYETYTTVQSLQRVGLKKYFGPKAGTAWVSLPQGPAHPVLQVVVPEWKGGQGQERELLRQSYEKVLQLAAERRSEAVAIPLLTADNPAFPAYIDFKIAVETIREFLESHTLDVFLIDSRPEVFGMPELREDVEQFLARNYLADELQWDTTPFEDGGSRFDTIVPYMQDFAGQTEASCAGADFGTVISDMPLPSCSASRSASWEEDDAKDVEEEMSRKYSRAAPKKAASRKGLPIALPRKAKPVHQSTGSLPKITGPDFPVDAGFSETLLELIDKTGKKDSEIYNKANVSRQHFSKIRNNPDYKPTKTTAIAFAIALELDMEQTQDLIGRAGYTLTRSSKFDVIIMYFIQQHNYNMFDINETLYEYDQSLLGA